MRKKKPGTYFDIINEKFQRHDDGSVTLPTYGIDGDTKEINSHAKIAALKAKSVKAETARLSTKRKK